MSKHGTPLSAGEGVFPPALKHISAGWIDQELLTVRKMAAAGATADEIGAACGKTWTWARSYIRRNKLVWNNKTIGGTPERHMVLSARSIAMHIDAGHGHWTDTGLEMFRAGVPIKIIAARVGVHPESVRKWFKRHGHTRPQLKRGRTPSHPDTEMAA